MPANLLLTVAPDTIESGKILLVRSTSVVTPLKSGIAV